MASTVCISDIEVAQARLLREQAKSTYPIDPEMVLYFKKKYLWLYILSWISLCLWIYLNISH